MFYDFLREEDSGSVHYLFTTENGLIYSVYFNPSEFSDYLEELPLLSKNGILFGFFPVSDEMGKRKKRDKLIAATIARIVKDYFETFGTEKVLLYHCDNGDGKQTSRNMLFSKWFNEKPDDLLLSKKDLEVTIDKGDGTCEYEYIGFIVSGNNKDQLSLLDNEFQEISTMLISRKQ